MQGIKVIADNCTACGACEEVCAYDAIHVIDTTAEINEKCTLCGACVDACDFDAIEIHRRAYKGEDPAAYAGICLYAEHRNGRLASVVLEIIGAARALQNDLNEPISAILLGKDVAHLAEELISYGVDEVWLMDDPAIGDFSEDIQADLTTEIIKEKKPAIFLGGGTVIGRSLLPRVAARVKTGLTADCTELTIDGDSKLLHQTRPAFGGNIMATILCENHRPQMATVRHKVMPEAEIIEGGHPGKVIEFHHLAIPEPKIEFLEFVEDHTQTVNLVEADYIVSGGRGLEDPKNFALIEELAEVVGGAVGASRAVVDAGWISYSHQVGQTGKTVKPVIYVACGISGAIQHLAGIKSSDIIIAINNDPEAPIFDVAHFGIVGDLLEIVPELTRQIKEAQ